MRRTSTQASFMWVLKLLQALENPQKGDQFRQVPALSDIHTPFILQPVCLLLHLCSYFSFLTCQPNSHTWVLLIWHQTTWVNYSTSDNSCTSEQGDSSQKEFVRHVTGNSQPLSEGKKEGSYLSPLHLPHSPLPHISDTRRKLSQPIPSRTESRRAVQVDFPFSFTLNPQTLCSHPHIGQTYHMLPLLLLQGSFKPEDVR